MLKLSVGDALDVDLMVNVKPDIRSPLKWAGGKKRVLPQIRKMLDKEGNRRLIEPFVGGGSVFLNLEFEEYLLCDANRDLINFYKEVKKTPHKFIRQARALFDLKNNTPENYYRLREQFNQSDDRQERALLFLYLNRHGYNGLCRYNSSGLYNVPFGQYKTPYFPEAELLNLGKRLKRARFLLGDFQKAFKKAEVGDVIYCDPPYSPINPTSSFTHYSQNGFSDRDQRRLVKAAVQIKQRGISTLISNHHVSFTEKLYQEADKQVVFNVQRSISHKGDKRMKVQEVLALYSK